MENSTKYKVAVKCCTYNQAQYITDALNGFVMQETDFPFVCCIIDDASTDGEQEVIRKYVAENFDLSEPDVAYEKETDDAYITYARHKSNKNCFFAVLYLKRNLYHDNQKKDGLVSEWMDNAEYIALCEGDDYWIEAKKLSLQAKFLDSNLDYGMTHTDFDILDGRRNHRVKVHSNGLYWPYSITDGLQVGTLTVMYRKSTYNGLPHFWVDKDWPMGDKPLWIEFSKYSKIHYIPCITAKYRVLMISASHDTDFQRVEFFEKKAAEITLFYADAFGVTINKRKVRVKYYENLMCYTACMSYDKCAKGIMSRALKEKSISKKMVVFYMAGKYGFIKKCIEKIRCFYWRHV